jgi:hypothetical protein
VTINAIKATGDELHCMQLAVGMIASGRHPPWGAARCVRHVILRTRWMPLNLVAGRRHLNPRLAVVQLGTSECPARPAGHGKVRVMKLGRPKVEAAIKKTLAAGVGILKAAGRWASAAELGEARFPGVAIRGA